MKRIHVRVPATTANLGPAFDCLGLALDLWNEAIFEVGGDGLRMEIEGQGSQNLATDQNNLIFVALKAAINRAGKTLPEGLLIKCHNRIPLNSGMGSSAAAVVAGLLAGNQLAGEPFALDELLEVAAKLEGHADNAAAALFGGLVLVNEVEGIVRAEALALAELHCVVVLPEVQLSTLEARSALRKEVALGSAVRNIGHALGLLGAFERGDLTALRNHMQDQLHQEQRLALILGGAEAIQAAQKAGGAAALSGAGPSIIAIVEPGREKPVSEAMRAPFAARGVATRHYLLKTSREGATISLAD